MTNNTEPIGYLDSTQILHCDQISSQGWQPSEYSLRAMAQRVGYLLIRETDDGAV